MSIQDKTSGNDGYQDIFWNLGQVIAWAGTRRPDAVDALSSSTAKMMRRPHSIVSGMPVLVMEGFVPEADQEGDKLDRVLDQVLRAFQSGALNASGARSIGDQREMIPPLEWIDLVFDLSLDGEMPVRHREGWNPLWCDVRVHRDEALREFPGTNGADAAIEKDKGGRPRPESAPPEMATPRPRGRKLGDGSYGPLDLPLLDEMKELISSHRAASPEAAARLLAGKAHGAGSPESKAERLAKRYRVRERGL